MGTTYVEQRVRFSDLSRDSKSVAAAADRGPVTITRRDADDLVLMRKSQADADKAGLALASQIIAVAVADWPDTMVFAERLHGPFPWMAFLSPVEQEEFAHELVETARACASVARFEPLATTIHAWQSTAEAYAAGWNHTEYEWLESPVEVERPGVDVD